MMKIVSGYGPFDTAPNDCWDVEIQLFEGNLEQAQEAASAIYEGNLDHPEAQYYWVMVLEPGETHPVLDLLAK